MSEMTDKAALALRKPFPPESVGKLPKAGMMLDYVGHAAVTDRLLTVDPEWSWDFALHRADGTPVLDDGQGNLWITLTVCGVTRKGVGDGKNAKERIGDAIRNAAMRFGVALDLWAKENLVEFAHAAGATAPADEPPPMPTKKAKATRAQVTKIQMLAGELGLDRDQRLAGVEAVIGRKVSSTNDLTPPEASAVIERMQAKATAAKEVQPALDEDGAA